MDVNRDTSSKGCAVLSDTHLIRIMHTFFELTEWTMTCNDMLTKVFHALSGSIAKGCFEDTLRGFMLYLTEKDNKKYRRNGKDITYLQFQLMIAGLINRFAKSDMLEVVIENDKRSISPHFPTMVYKMRLNSNTLNLIDTSPYSGVQLITANKSTVMSPTQGALLLYLFTKYYSDRSIIENSAVCSFLEILEHIDDAMFGSVQAKGHGMDYTSHTAGTSIEQYLLQTYENQDQVVSMYIKKEYSEIFKMLNTCFLQYDFLVNEPDHANKILLEHYVAAVLGLQSKPDEFSIWTLHVDNFGTVSKSHELSTNDNDTDINHETSGFIILVSLMLLNPKIPTAEAAKVQYERQITKIEELLRNGIYSNKNPYDKTVMRNIEAKIPDEKLAKLNSLHTRLNPNKEAPAAKKVKEESA